MCIGSIAEDEEEDFEEGENDVARSFGSPLAHESIGGSC